MDPDLDMTQSVNQKLFCPRKFSNPCSFETHFCSSISKKFRASTLHGDCISSGDWNWGSIKSDMMLFEEENDMRISPPITGAQVNYPNPGDYRFPKSNVHTKNYAT